MGTGGPIPAGLHDAFRMGDAGALRGILTAHPELRALIDAPVFGFDAPAIVACAGNGDMVDVLLEFGADPNRRSAWWAGGFHALHSATGGTADRLIAAGAVPDACAAAHLDRPQLLAELLAADPSCVHERGGDGQTPLHFAQSRVVIDMLLEAGAVIDARDVDHRSTAAEWMLRERRGAGRYALAEYLVERGASADIFLATALGLTDRVIAMVRADPTLLSARTGRGSYGEQPPSSYHIYFWTIGDARSPLDVARQFEQEETLAALLELATPAQRLMHACRSGDEHGARAIILESPDIMSSLTPDDHRAISDAAWSGDARAVALMLDLGFDPRTPGQDSGTALHCAAWQGSAETVAVLLAHADAGALLEIRDAQHGGTPLGWCCHGSLNADRTHDHAGVARLLIAAGASAAAGGDASEAVLRVIARPSSNPR